MVVPFLSLKNFVFCSFSREIWDKINCIVPCGEISSLLHQIIGHEVDKHTHTHKKNIAFLDDVLIMLMQNYHWQEGVLITVD